MRKYQIKITNEAIGDIENIILYYNQQQPGLGKKFAIELRKKFKQLKKTPYSSVVVHGNKIFPSLKIHPYYIAISVDKENLMVIIWGIFHHKQSPDNWP